jgi:transposase
MNQVVTMGLDIAKSVFRVRGIDADGAVVVRRRLTRSRVLPFFEKQAPVYRGLGSLRMSTPLGA